MQNLANFQHIKHRKVAHNVVSVILTNHLDIAVVNALVIWLCKDPTRNTISSFFARIGFSLIILPQMEHHLMQPGMCLGKLSGEGIFSGKCPGVIYGGIVRAGKYPGKKRPGRNVGNPMQDYN